MKNILLLFCIACLPISCGSKKEFTRSNSVGHLKTNEQLYAELYQTTRLLELLDIKFRQVETRDSVGNVRTETNVDISKKTDRQDLDSTKIQAEINQTGEKLVKTELKKERSGVIGSWVWIIGFIALIVMALVASVYILKRQV